MTKNLNEDQREQLRHMLNDIVDNTPKPKDFEGSQDDFRRDWLYTLADVAVDLAKAVPSS